MTRSPLTDPIPGDSLSYNGWTIVVLAREGDLVKYTAASASQSKKGSQNLAEWSAWTPKAKISARGGAAEPPECLTISQNAAGPCVVCKEFVKHDAHITEEGIHCAACCKSSHNPRPRKPRAPKAVAAPAEAPA